MVIRVNRAVGIYTCVGITTGVHVNMKKRQHAYKIVHCIFHPPSTGIYSTAVCHQQDDANGILKHRHHESAQQQNTQSNMPPHISLGDTSRAHSKRVAFIPIMHLSNDID